MVDAVDVFGKFSEKWCEKTLELQKWNEKCAEIELFLKAASVPKLAANGAWQPLVSMVKKLLTEANKNVVINALKVYGVLCAGLRKNFSGPAKLLFPLVITKFKEKQTLMIEETRQALDKAGLYCVTLEDVAQDLKDCFADKTPALRVQTLAWVERMVQGRLNNNDFSQKHKDEFQREILPTLKRLFEDGVGEVREAALAFAAHFRAFIDRAELDKLLADLPKAKKDKVLADSAAAPPAKDREKEKEKEKEDASASPVKQRKEPSKPGSEGK